MKLDLRNIPTTELHLHLEGCISPGTLKSLAGKYCHPSTQIDDDLISERLSFATFSQFLESWRWMTDQLREPEDFTLLALDVANQLKSQGVIYAELHFSPPDFIKHGLSVGEVATSIRQGLDHCQDGPRINLIIDLCRRYGSELGGVWLDEASEVAREAGIVAVGLGGPEHLVPPEDYTVVFDKAAQLGFRRVAHAGEAAGPASVWGAVRNLGAERIGHGVRAAEDDRLIEHLAERKIPIEICLTSNLCTGAVSRLEHHPVRKFFDAGIPIVLSSDDPTFFSTDILAEYLLLREKFEFTDYEILTVARNGIDASFVSDGCRDRLHAEFDSLLAATAI